ncbi:MAG: TadE family type IV pilus minor pilin [Mycobacterium sp.]
MEAAFGIAALVSVLVLCSAGIQAVSMQVRCVDASREAARLAARGDEADARSVAHRIAPRGAALEVRRDGDYVVARVKATSRLLPAITIAAESVSAMEPGS